MQYEKAYTHYHLFLIFYLCLYPGHRHQYPRQQRYTGYKKNNKGMLLPKVNLVSIYDSITVYSLVVGLFLLP